MADAKLSILLEANTAGVNSSLTILQHQLERLQRLASLPNLSFRQQERLNQLLIKTQGEVARFNRAIESSNPSFGRLNSATNTANLTLINTGRIFQDLPFGILGVANNINPLIESFQRLSQQAKAAGTSIGSQLLGALKGGGGIGIAFSLLTSALTFATIGLAGFGRGLFGAKKEAKETSDSLNALANNIVQQAAKLTVLVGAVQNVNTKYGDKQKFLKAINQEYKTYIDNLGLEKITLENIGNAYDRIIESLIRQATVKGLQDEITNAVESTAKEIIRLQVEEEKLRLSNLKRVQEEEKTVQDVLLKKKKVVDDEISNNEKVLQSQQNLDRGQDTISDNLSKRIQKDKGVKLDGVFANEQLRQSQVKTQNSTINYEEKVKGLTEKLKLQLAPLLNLVTNFGDLDIKLNNLKSTTERLGESLGDAGDKLPVVDFEIPANIIFTTESVKIGIQEAIEEAGRSGIVPEAEFRVKIRPDLSSLQKSLEELRVESVSSLAEGLGEAFATGDLQNALKGFVSVIGSGIQSIGKQLIALGFAAEKVKLALASLFNNPFAMIAAGAALVAIGAAVKSSLSSGIQGRQHGGPVKAGQPYIVGEVGKELFVPQTSGVIISNNQLRNLNSPLSSSGIGVSSGIAERILVEVVGRINGQDILLSGARTMKSNGFNV